jgi:hypothetical protein
MVFPAIQYGKNQLLEVERSYRPHKLHGKSIFYAILKATNAMYYPSLLNQNSN